MQLVITTIAVIGGLAFSVIVALLVEEVIFGQVFRLFFSRKQAHHHTLAADEVPAMSTAAPSPKFAANNISR